MPFDQLDQEPSLFLSAKTLNLQPKAFHKIICFWLLVSTLQDWDKPQNIPDPDAKKPDDWDDEIDGEWEPPMIDNPDYKVGGETCKQDVLFASC